MGNYDVFLFILILYAQISFLASMLTNPRSQFGVYFQIGFQFAVLTLCCFTPIWWPITSVVGWLAWCGYCLFMYFVLALQISGAVICVINKNKVYDCQIIHAEENFVLGQIKEGHFSTPVIMKNTGYEKKDTTVKVIYKKHFDRAREVAYLDPEQRKRIKIEVAICVEKANI